MSTDLSGRHDARGLLVTASIAYFKAFCNMCDSCLTIVKPDLLECSHERASGMKVHQWMALLQCNYSALVLECHLTLNEILDLVSLCAYSTVMQRAKIDASIVMQHCHTPTGLLLYATVEGGSQHWCP